MYKEGLESLSVAAEREVISTLGPTYERPVFSPQIVFEGSVHVESAFTPEIWGEKSFDRLFGSFWGSDKLKRSIFIARPELIGLEGLSFGNKKTSGDEMMQRVLISKCPISPVQIQRDHYVVVGNDMVTHLNDSSLPHELELEFYAHLNGTLDNHTFKTNAIFVASAGISIFSYTSAFASKISASEPAGEAEVRAMPRRHFLKLALGTAGAAAAFVTKLDRNSGSIMELSSEPGMREVLAKVADRVVALKLDTNGIVQGRTAMLIQKTMDFGAETMPANTYKRVPLVMGSGHVQNFERLRTDEGARRVAIASFLDPIAWLVAETSRDLGVDPYETMEVMMRLAANTTAHRIHRPSTDVISREELNKVVEDLPTTSNRLIEEVAKEVAKKHL